MNATATGETTKKNVLVVPEIGPDMVEKFVTDNLVAFASGTMDISYVGFEVGASIAPSTNLKKKNG